MRISLGMIVRNEEKTLEKCLQSAAPYVDEIIIGLAGESTDDTPNIAQKYATKVLSIEWEDDFGAARNAVLEHCTGDYFFWLDGDDELIGGERLRGYIGRNPRIDAFHMGYDYGRGPNGEPTSFLVRERIVRAGMGWHWDGRVHEFLTTETPHEYFYIPDIVVKHHGLNKPRGERNLLLLYKDLKEQEPNPSQRLLFYLGREEMLKGRDREAILHLQRFVAASKWEPEAYQAAHTIADIHRRNSRFDEAEESEQLAIRIQPAWPDAYYGLAEIALARREYQACIEWTKVGSSKEPPSTTLVINPRDYDFNPLMVYAAACVGLEDWEMALKNYSDAYAISPSDGIIQQAQRVRVQLESSQALENFLALVEHLARFDEWLKVRQLFTSAPKAIETHPKVRELWRMVLENTAHIENPKLMEEFYINNPGWAAMSDEQLWSDEWFEHPRVQFAKQVIDDTAAQTVIDLGSSDGFITLPIRKAQDITIDGIDLDPRCIDLANKRARECGFDNVTYHQGNISLVEEWASCERFKKYDVALLFETIEHVVDPVALLDTVDKSAHRVALTTPHMAWELGQTDWKRHELKGHLRIFDLSDIEMLLKARGRINTLYRHANGAAGWIFADYEPGGTTDKNISIVCPGSLEEWGPLKLKREGLGGSELAVIRVAEEMANSGHLVTVFNDIDSPGYFNSVRYRDKTAFIPDVSSDMLIAWRYPEVADLNPQAKRLVLWMHDVHSENFTQERYEKFDDIVLLSEWHKQYFLKKYPFVDPTKVTVIGNGVDHNRFTDKVERDNNRVVYASSPDRGLDVILEHIWPRVLAEVPDAELHYYYGWGNFETLAKYYAQHGEFQRKVADLSTRTHNVVNHGRVSQAKLATEMLRGSIWLYPTYFAETYCIVGVEAQEAGLLPIYNPLAGLTDTVKSGIAIEGDVYDLETCEKYAQAVIQSLKNPPPDELRESIRSKSPAQAWANVAEQWLQLIPTMETDT